MPDHLPVRDEWERLKATIHTQGGEPKTEAEIVEADRALFMNIGLLAISWGELESAIDDWIELVHEHFGGSAIEADRPRTSLKRKLAYLRKFISSAKGSGAQKQDYLSFLKEIAAGSEYRHDVIHSAYRRVNSGDGTAELRRRLHKGHAKYREIEIDSAQVGVAAILAQRQAIHAVKITMTFWESLIEREISASEQTPNATRLSLPIPQAFRRFLALASRPFSKR